MRFGRGRRGDVTAANEELLADSRGDELPPAAARGNLPLLKELAEEGNEAALAKLRELAEKKNPGARKTLLQLAPRHAGARAIVDELGISE